MIGCTPTPVKYFTDNDDDDDDDDDGGGGGLCVTDVDSKIRFSIEPLPGDDAFDQWRDGMKAVAGLPMGIPADFRKKVRPS